MTNKYTEMKCRTCDNLYIRNNLDTYKTTCFPCWKKSKGFKQDFEKKVKTTYKILYQ